jgi:hypothetical protein
MEKVLDKAASDSEWRQLLIDDPEAAMREANFPEAQELEQAQPLEQGPPRYPQESEVVGQVWGGYGGSEFYGGHNPACTWQWSWSKWKYFYTNKGFDI